VREQRSLNVILTCRHLIKILSRAIFEALGKEGTPRVKSKKKNKKKIKI
jgi:hypothetical protein